VLAVTDFFPTRIDLPWSSCKLDCRNSFCLNFYEYTDDKIGTKSKKKNKTEYELNLIQIDRMCYHNLFITIKL